MHFRMTLSLALTFLASAAVTRADAPPYMRFTEGNALSLTGTADLTKVNALLNPYGLEAAENPQQPGVAQIAVNAVIYRNVEPSNFPDPFQELFVGVWARRIGDTQSPPGAAFLVSYIDSLTMKLTYSRVWKLPTAWSLIRSTYADDGAEYETRDLLGRRIARIVMGRGAPTMTLPPIDIDTRAFSLIDAGSTQRAASYRFTGKGTAYARPFNATLGDELVLAPRSKIAKILAQISFVPTLWLNEVHVAGDTWKLDP